MNEHQLRSQLITPDVAEFLISLHEQFENIRRHLLMKRQTRRKEYAEGERPHFLKETESIRKASWVVAPAPLDLQDRRVEITGPAEPKMMIQGLNSGARVYMADFEDALSPTWINILLGHGSLIKAVRRELKYSDENGKIYQLNPTVATLLVRPRGLHLVEGHFQIRGNAISASLFDLGLYCYHNAQELLKRGTGPYFYLPKIENHEEASWWNEVFNYIQDFLSIPRGTIRATVLIETVTAAFEMEEILYSLREHASGLNAGRWDYIFSMIKNFSTEKHFLTPDRAHLTMDKPFLEAYCRLIVQTCHKRGAHAIGGMSAFIPQRSDREKTWRALHQVSDDKRREARWGFDGTWVAHPDLVAIADEEFSHFMRLHSDQKAMASYRAVTAQELLDVSSAGGEVTAMGVRGNIQIILRYMDRWFDGVGAVAIHSMMEDLATVEISRSQLWQWLYHEVQLSDGRHLNPQLFNEFLEAELQGLIPENLPFLDKALRLLLKMVFAETLPDFMSLIAYEYLNQAPIQTQGDPTDVEYRNSSATLRL